MRPSSLYFPLILFLVFTDLTIPHLLAYLLSTRYERHRNVHMGFALVKLRLWIELLAFEASEHCYAVARLALGLDRLDRCGTSTTEISYGVFGQDGVWMSKEPQPVEVRTLSMHAHSYVHILKSTKHTLGST
jgi:hypothetical protein